MAWLFGSRSDTVADATPPTSRSAARIDDWRGISSLADMLSTMIRPSRSKPRAASRRNVACASMTSVLIAKAIAPVNWTSTSRLRSRVPSRPPAGVRTAASTAAG